MTKTIFDPEKRLKKALKTIEDYHPKNGLANTLLRATDDIKRFYPIVASQNQDFKTKVEKVILKYNTLIDQKHGPLKRLLRWFKGFFTPTKKKITLPPIPQKPKLEDVVTSHAISIKEKDAFYMKALSLLHKHYPSFDQAKISIKNTPIHSQMLPETTILSQTLSPFPGMTLIVKGAFKRSKTGAPMPISHSFKIKAFPRENLFPSAKEHTGFTLSSALIPCQILRDDQIPFLQHLFEKRNEAAKTLSSKDFFKLQRVRQDEFKHHEEDLLKKHLTLICLLTGEKMHGDNVNLNDLANFYDAISLQLFQKPYHDLLMQWTHQQSPDLFNADAKMRKKAAQNTLENAQQTALKKLRDDFPSLQPLAITLAQAGREIILQHLSEIIGFQAPIISSLSKKMQTLALFQLQNFIESQTHPIPVLSLMEQDIHILSSLEIPPLAKRIEEYYSRP